MTSPQGILILLDYILDRGTASLRAEQIFDACVRGELECCIAPHSLTNIFYILRRVYSADERKFIIRNLLALCEVQAIDKGLMERALDDDRFEDFEDALQMACAEQWQADTIITGDQDFNL